MHHGAAYRYSNETSYQDADVRDIQTGASLGILYTLCLFFTLFTPLIYSCTGSIEFYMPVLEPGLGEIMVDSHLVCRWGSCGGIIISGIPLPSSSQVVLL